MHVLKRMTNGTKEPKKDKGKNITGIHKKLNAIMADIGILKKDKRNEHFKYEYLSEEAIKKAVQPLLVKHGVNFQVEITDVRISEKITVEGSKTITESGNKTTLLMTYRFVDIETGETLEGTFAGEGVDNQDKGTWKALTGAIKYILTTTFLVPTGDDPEHGNVDAKTTAAKTPERPEETPSWKKAGAPNVQMISQPQIKKIMVLLKELGKGDAWFKQWIKKESKKDLTMDEATRYIDIMQKKADEGASAEFGTCGHCGTKQGEDHQSDCDLLASQGGPGDMPE